MTLRGDLRWTEANLKTLAVMTRVGTALRTVVARQTNPDSRYRNSTSKVFAQNRRMEQAPAPTKSASEAAVGGPPRAGTRPRYQPRVSINHVELSGHEELDYNQSYQSSDDEVYRDVRQDFEDVAPPSGNGR